METGPKGLKDCLTLKDCSTIKYCLTLKDCYTLEDHFTLTQTRLHLSHPCPFPAPHAPIQLHTFTVCRHPVPCVNCLPPPAANHPRRWCPRPVCPSSPQPSHSTCRTCCSGPPRQRASAQTPPGAKKRQARLFGC